METRAHYVLLGGFALAVTAALMLFALWIARASFNQSYAVYDVVFDGPVRGLAQGGEVRFQGIKVGEVTNLRLDPDNANRVLARVRIDAATPVRTSSTAQLEPLGLTGVSLVQLDAGDPDDPFLRARLGQAPPMIPGRPGQFEGILAAGETVALRAAATLESLQSVLSPENVRNVTQIIKDLEALSQELEANKALVANTNETVVALRDTARAIQTAAMQVEALSSEGRGAVAQLQADATGAIRQTERTLAAFETTAERGTAALDTIDEAASVAATQTLPDLSIAVSDLRRLSMSLEQIADQLNRSPADFVRTSKRPTVQVDP